MDFTKTLLKSRKVVILIVSLYICHGVNGYNEYTIQGGLVESIDVDIVHLRQDRVKRAAEEVTKAPVPTLIANTSATLPPVTPPSTVTRAVLSNNTTKQANVTASTTTAISVTQIPLLGRDGHGIRKPIPDNQPKVSEPIYSDDSNFTDVFKEVEVESEHNSTLKYDYHVFYNSTFINNGTYFTEYWTNLTKVKTEVHESLSKSHRKATTVTLHFSFPFYGHGIKNITVATGGFIYTGEHVHNWLAATQYIAPLMANFDTSLTNDSTIKLYSDDDRFIVFWENVTLQEEKTMKFTFASVLFKNGDIDFVYKSIPMPIEEISDSDHPVKVGISDAYLNDRIFFLIRRKTIYEYHRVSFKSYKIVNATILRLTALPTCLQHENCSSCVTHDTGFDCMWCEAIHKCSSGTDRNKQDWMMRNCDKMGNHVTNESMCPAGNYSGQAETGNTAYTTDTDQSPYHTAVLKTLNSPKQNKGESPVQAPATEPQYAHSSLGGAVAAFVAVAAVCSVAAWALYAFKNPHTRSGQLLIKYRPSQWSWRRGEARYTAATIHM